MITNYRKSSKGGMPEYLSTLDRALRIALPMVTRLVIGPVLGYLAGTWLVKIFILNKSVTLLFVFAGLLISIVWVLVKVCKSKI